MPKSISPLGAICFAIAGFTFWVLADSAIKYAGQSKLPNYEVVAFLGIFMAAFMLAVAVWRGQVKELWPRRPARQLFRAALDLGNNLFVVVALRHLSLTLFYILIFLAPMLVVLLGRLFLHERLGWRKTAAVLIGFLGVVIAVDPSRRLERGAESVMPPAPFAFPVLPPQWFGPGLSLARRARKA